LSGVDGGRGGLDSREEPPKDNELSNLARHRAVLPASRRAAALQLCNTLRAEQELVAIFTEVVSSFEKGTKGGSRYALSR